MLLFLYQYLYINFNFICFFIKKVFHRPVFKYAFIVIWIYLYIKLGIFYSYSFFLFCLKIFKVLILVNIFFNIKSIISFLIFLSHLWNILNLLYNSLLFHSDFLIKIFCFWCLHNFAPCFHLHLLLTFFMFFINNSYLFIF